MSLERLKIRQMAQVPHGNPKKKLLYKMKRFYWMNGIKTDKNLQQVSHIDQINPNDVTEYNIQL